MKITKVRAVLLSGSIGIMVMSGGVALGETSDILTNPSSLQVQGQIYQVQGRNSNGSRFNTCFRFGAGNILRVDRELGRLRYAQSGRRDFQAVRIARFFNGQKWVTLKGLGMNGSLIGDRIRGQGIRENGRTFTFNGRRNPSCVVNLSTLQEIPPEPILPEPILPEPILPGNEPPDPEPAIDEPPTTPF
jgi:hypothetical protein